MAAFFKMDLKGCSCVLFWISTSYIVVCNSKGLESVTWVVPFSFLFLKNPHFPDSPPSHWNKGPTLLSQESQANSALQKVSAGLAILLPRLNLDHATKFRMVRSTLPKKELRVSFVPFLLRYLN